MRLARLTSITALCFFILLTLIIILIRTQPYDDHTIRAILRPSDCHAPCFIGIQPGITEIREVYKLLGANPWVSKMTSHIVSDCCSMALSWQWNGKQPANLANGDNSVYFTYDAQSGIQTVQNIALHTQIAMGYAILVLGAWPDESALQGLNSAYVEMFYPQQFIHVTTTVPCPLTRWDLWQAPMTLAINRDSWNMSGMKPLSAVC